MKDLAQIQQTHVLNWNLATKRSKEEFHQIGHYLIGHILGKGGFATVYKGLQIYTKTQVAVKVIDLTNLTQKQMLHVRKEISIQKNLNHQNIVRIYEVVWTESKVYLFMELVKGTELFQYVSKHGPLRESVAAKVFQQIVQAVGYLHENGVAHRDIKTENIVIDSEFNAKLIDFGLAKQFRTPASHDEFFTTFCGSPSYTSPELLEKKSYSGQMVDIWCLGVTLYVMLEASLPFDQADDLRRKQNIRNLRWHPAVCSSPQANSVYNSIFTFSDHRVSLEEIANSTFLEKYFLIENNSLSRSQQISKLNLTHSQIVSKVSQILSITQDKIISSLKNFQLNQSYGLYQILLNQKIHSKQLQGRAATLTKKRETYLDSKLSSIRKTIYSRESSKRQTHTNIFTPNKKNTLKTFPILNKGYFQEKGKQFMEAPTSSILMNHIIQMKSLNLRFRAPKLHNMKWLEKL